MVEKTAGACKEIPAAPPELSVVVPVLNDSEALRSLLVDLDRQQGVAFEVVVSDGGSTDDLSAALTALTPHLSYPLQFCAGAPGRGAQLNRGAARAQAELLLFLHADSLLPDPHGLRQTLDLWRRENSGEAPLVLHFSLTFRHSPASPLRPWSLLEWKARSGRPWTVHGDQGLLLARRDLAALGGFAEDLPVLEDTLLVERIRAQGRLLRAPVVLSTSGRRFEQEGIARRQTLNAVLVACGAIGFDDGLRAMAGAYRPPAEAQPLPVSPVLRALLNDVGRRPWRERLRLWYAAGRFVHSQAWQLGLWRDYRHQGAALPAAGGRWTRWCDRWFIPATAHPPGWLLTSLLTWLGVRLLLWRARCRERRG